MRIYQQEIYAGEDQPTGDSHTVIDFQMGGKYPQYTDNENAKIDSSNASSIVIRDLAAKK